ncbi:MAG: type II secretion system protein [Armatimonadota bacterium]
MATQRRRRGFTLIELLTVIGIIAVLVAILFPVFASARARARQARCLSNMQQIGQAIEGYVQDNGGFIPPWSITHPGVAPTWTPPPEAIRNVADPSVATWDVSIMSYLRNENLLICPDNPNPQAREARSYAIAQYTQRPMVVGGTTVAIGGYKDDIPAPHATVMCFEKGNNPPGAWGDALGQNVYQSHDDPLKPDEMWHNGGKNFLFCDYHAEWFKKGTGPFAHEGTPDHSEEWGSEPGVCCDWGRPTKTNAAGFQGDWPMP